MFQVRAVLLAAALVAAPVGAQGADLVVWWEKGFYAQEDAAIAEIIAAFEQEKGKEVELVHYSNEELPEKLVATLEADRPPDFAFGLWLSEYSAKWAFEDRLVDLSDVVGTFSNLFDPDALNWVMLLSARTQKRALYGLPICSRDKLLARLEEPFGACRFCPRRHPARMVRVLVLLV